MVWDFLSQTNYMPILKGNITIIVLCIEISNMTVFVVFFVFLKLSLVFIGSVSLKGKSC